MAEITVRLTPAEIHLVTRALSELQVRLSSQGMSQAADIPPLLQKLTDAQETN